MHKYYLTIILILSLAYIYLIIRSRRLANELDEIRKNQQETIIHIAHQLKTPLATAKNKLHLLKGEKRDLGFIDQTLDKLTFFIKNLLLIAQLDTNTLPFFFQDIDLTNTMKNLVSYFEVASEEKNIQFNYDIQEGVMVEIDKARLTDALSNIITNAIKYCDENSKIELTLKKKSNIHITITDNGPGISSTVLKNIFQPFYKGENSNGTGIGLYISKKTLENMDAILDIESVEGKGTTFYITI